MGLQKVKKAKMCINAHRGDNEIELGFPENWEITECRMAGHDKAPLTGDEMRLVLHTPIGTPRLREMAKGIKKVCIIFDDICRPTPTSRIIPFILEELHAGGVADEQIRFLSAQGNHKVPTYPDLLAKLGREIVEKYPVYRHNVYENLVDVGRTTRGTPVRVNREFASCDLRLGIGTIMPIGSNTGFGGGGKLVLPGVCGIETVDYHHKNMRGDDFRPDIEEAARLAGLHFKVDVVVNHRREVIGLFAGDLVAEHRAGVKLASQVYRTETVKNADVVVVNSYPDEVQLIKVLWCIGISLREGGDIVILSHAPDGQMTHFLNNRWGTDYGGRNYQSSRASERQKKAARIIIVGPDLSKVDRDDVGPREKVLYCRDWAEALVKLVDRNGSGTKVGVFPCGALQMPEEWL